MDAMYEGLWQFILAVMAVAGFQFLILLTLDLLAEFISNRWV